MLHSSYNKFPGMPVLYSGTFYPAYQSQMYLYQGGIFLNDLLVAYKFGVRCGGDLSPREGILLYKLHASHTTERFCLPLIKCPDPNTGIISEKSF